jgi:hypothetical protein
MKYTAPSFSVPATGKAPENCKHGWLDVRGKCVMCGEQIDSAREIVRTPIPNAHGFKPDKQLTGWHSRDCGKHAREYMPSWILEAAAKR